MQNMMYSLKGYQEVAKHVAKNGAFNSQSRTKLKIMYRIFTKLKDLSTLKTVT